MSIGKLVAVQAQADSVIELRWDDGFKVRLDLGPLVRERAVLKPLLDPVEFASAHLSSDNWSVEWPCGVDFGAPQLRRWAADGFDKKFAA